MRYGVFSGYSLFVYHNLITIQGRGITQQKAQYTRLMNESKTLEIGRLCLTSERMSYNSRALAALFI